MLGKNRVIAIVPARAGSKRLPGKNVKLLGGKPLICWTIESALGSKYVDEVVVNTDCLEIASLVRKYERILAYIRPPELANDTATTNSVILDYISAANLSKDTIVALLQPTSPFRTSEDIDGAIELLLKKNADGVVSVCECEHCPMWSNTLPKDRNLSGFIRQELVDCRSQDVPTFYRLNGALYIFKVNSLQANKGIHYSKFVYAYPMDKERSVDIDTKGDFLFANYLLAHQD